MNLEERFWAKVERTEACWVWHGAKARGYGSFHDSRVQKRVRAHRFAYELLVGAIPEGLTLDHLCRNPACVNPAHLEPVTMRENILRTETPPALNARKTHCKRGHAFDQVNTNFWRKERVCRACRSEKRRKAPTS